MGAHGVLAATTLNFLMIGWTIDFMVMPFYLRTFNSKTVYFARHDRSCKRILRVPLLFMLWFIIFSFGFIKIPRLLQDAGIVDIDAAEAGTKENPYELFNIQRGDSTVRVSDAYNEAYTR